MNQRGFRGGKGPALYPTGSIYPNVKNEKGKGGRVHGTYPVVKRRVNHRPRGQKSQMK